MRNDVSIVAQNFKSEDEHVVWCDWVEEKGYTVLANLYRLRGPIEGPPNDRAICKFIDKYYHLSYWKEIQKIHQDMTEGPTEIFSRYMHANLRYAALSNLMFY